ncbi:Trk system potassium transporter TrkA [Psychroflexus gondwanensis]|jgi:trk system potassium uptake protein TrkA|uniref:Trk system potassium uptake protein TrkA n=1 Tax=Psychroflexus gondwanensis ACAM 44 TaxID=1189619 RepID=N1X2W0_9FLAO|nr:Trk system potassium transporter TrkA [Psychroflexus gondwanensis]EMY82388.1 potassium transporter peripheral membrane component [Psychroflexus gondwanensis ACAM 44]TXE18987.1 Trk system potassium transporter TrkA [Psychroflexus gondwanensis]
MKIIIAGAGEVGFHLAKLFSYESHAITLLDIDEDRLEYANKHLDIKTLIGDATLPSSLKEADVVHSDMVIAVTSNQSINISVCVFAKQMGAGRTVARVSNQELLDFHQLESDKVIDMKALGIDEMISPEALAAKEVEMLLNQSAFTDTFKFDDGALTMMGLTLRSKAPFIGNTVEEAADIFPGLHFVPIALQRYGTQLTIIPRGDTIFKRGDRVYFITDSEGVEELYKLTGAEKRSIKKVMILGGSNIGRTLAKKLCKKNFSVKMIEKDHKKATHLANILPDALVINADGRNVEILKEENISKMDAFIAVTEDSETNIITCLVANSKGVRKTIALVENMDYFQLSHSIGIHSLVNKKLLAANSIFRYLRKGDVIAMTKLNNMNAELLEFVVKANSKVTNSKIVDIDFPRTAVVGGVIRDGKGIIALGDFKIREGDRIVVCTLPKSIKSVENLFC